MSANSRGDGVGVPVARLEDLRPDRGVARRVEGREVAVFLVDGEPVAYEGRCRHRGGPLAEGLARDGVVTCPLHWWRYDLRTGELVWNRAIRLERFPAEVCDGEVVVSVPRSAAAAPGAGAPLSIRDRLLARAREQR